MHAFLYIGGSIADRIQAIGSKLDGMIIPSYDRITLTAGDKPTIGIDQVRAFTKQLYVSSHGKNGTAGIIPDAATLTAQAQQALLKTIEEPPLQVTVHIGAVSETQVLPTIVSRCQIIGITAVESVFSDTEISACMTYMKEIDASRPGQRISLLLAVGKTKDDAKRWIDCAILACRLLLREHPNDRNSHVLISHIHGLLEAKMLAANNVHPIQLLEHVFLQTAV